MRPGDDDVDDDADDDEDDDDDDDDDEDDVPRLTLTCLASPCLV